MTTPATKGSPGRTRLITFASIAAVTVAGAFAVAANIGILSATETKTVGSLSAAELAPPRAQVVDVVLSDPTTVGTTAQSKVTISTSPPVTEPQGAATVQEFAVDTAGTIGVVSSKGTIRLEEVRPSAGWSWKLVQSKPSSLTITLTHSGRTLEFTATAKADGTVGTALTEPFVKVAPATRPPTSSASSAGQSPHEYEGSGDDD